MRGIVLLLSLAILPAGVARAQTAECYVNLSWDANSEPDLAFYTIHMGTAAGVYGTRLTVDKSRTTLAIPLPSGQTYHFAATATNVAGLTSGYSNPVQTLVSCSGTGGTRRVPARIIGVEATICREGICGT